MLDPAMVAEVAQTASTIGASTLLVSLRLHPVKS